MVKVKMVGDDDEIIIEKPKKKTKGAQNGTAALALVPKTTRQRGSKKAVAKKSSGRTRRVKNPAQPRPVEEMSADEVFLQAWDYAYNVRHKRT
jgi:hypothetical protein